MLNSMFAPPPATQFSARTSRAPNAWFGKAATTAAGAPVSTLKNGRAMIWLPPRSEAAVNPFLLLWRKKKSPSRPADCASSNQKPLVSRKPPRNSLFVRSRGKRTSVPGFEMMPAKFAGVPGGEDEMAGGTCWPDALHRSNSRRVQTRPFGLANCRLSLRFGMRGPASGSNKSGAATERRSAAAVPRQPESPAGALSPGWSGY